MKKAHSRARVEKETGDLHHGDGVVAALQMTCAGKGWSKSDLSHRLQAQPDYISRLMRHPYRLATCSPQLLARMANLIGWRVTEVLADVGLVPAEELLLVRPSLDDMIERGIRDLQVSGMAGGLRDGVETLSRDHQVLLVRLFRAAQWSAATAAVD